MKSKYLDHKGKQIMLCDYSNFGSDGAAVMAEIDAADAIICQQPENSVLVLLDARNSVASTEVVNHVKKGSLRTRKHIRKMAILGVTGVRRIILEAVSKFSGQQATVFDDMDEAKDWLVA